MKPLNEMPMEAEINQKRKKVLFKGDIGYYTTHKYYWKLNVKSNENAKECGLFFPVLMGFCFSPDYDSEQEAKEALQKFIEINNLTNVEVIE